jgi:hypothetical protein
MDAHTAALLQRAADDEATLHLPGLPEVPFGQHAQGAVEKLLKALINERGQKYPYTHDLDVLALKLTLLSESLPTLPMALGDLTDYAMTLRYEGSGQLPPPLDRRVCLEAVELLRVHVAGRIQALSPPPALPTP